MRARSITAACLLATGLAAVIACGGNVEEPAGPTPDVVRIGAPAKVFQLLGDVDRELAPPTPVPGQTLTRFGIAGADLGFPVALHGKTIFLFADVVAVDDNVTHAYADAVGWTTALGPGPFAVDFFPPNGGTLPFAPLTVGGTLLGMNDGPSSAFVDGDDLYVLFDVGYCKDAKNPPNKWCTPAIDPVTGVAALHETGFLAVSHDDGLTFAPLFDLPAPMVWTQVATVQTSSLPAVPWTAPETLLVWGQKDGAPVVAAAPRHGIADPGWFSTWRWWTGSAWSAHVQEAASIMAADGCGGNFSVSLIAGMNKWLMTRRCPGDAGSTRIDFRFADAPLGPWSAAQRWLDPDADGASCNFVHRACPVGGPCCDSDITGVGDFNETVPGHVYGAYVMPDLGTWDASSSTATVYSLLSTFNPYTVVLLRTDLRRMR